MKKYYELEYSCDKKIVGIDDGTVQLEIKESSFQTKQEYDDFYLFLDQLDFLEKNKTKQFKIEKVFLRRKAKVTDYMMYFPLTATTEYFISEKVKNILTKYVLTPSIYYETSIATLNEKVYLFCNLRYNAQVIDFSKSAIYKGHKLLEMKYLDCNSYEQYKEIYLNYPLIKFESIYLDDYALYKNDYISIAGVGTFISEQLKKEFEDEKIKGVDFLDNNKLRID